VRKVYVFIMVLALMLASCCEQKADIEAEKTQVKAVLDSYVASVEAEDMNLYAQNVAHDPAMVNFGGFGDPIVGWDALKKVMEDQNASLSETKITSSDLAIHVSETGKLAWATCLWRLQAMMGENPIDLPVRCTWVLERRDNRWVIVHFHKSMAAG
jgi:uncharacterized protein (TIGR02246 family)